VFIRVHSWLNGFWFLVVAPLTCDSLLNHLESAPPRYSQELQLVSILAILAILAFMAILAIPAESQPIQSGQPVVGLR
jgi:hypothetical protein